MKGICRWLLPCVFALLASCTQKNNGDTYSGVDGSADIGGGDSGGSLGGGSVVETYPINDAPGTVGSGSASSSYGCPVPYTQLSTTALQHGLVTADEINCFTAFMNTRLTTVDQNATGADVTGTTHYLLELAPNNYSPLNAWGYGNSGNFIETMAMTYELSAGVKSVADRMPILDFVIRGADAGLLARNDLNEKRVMWTGKNDDPVWPSNAPTSPFATFTGAVDGDIAGHIAYAAKQILLTPDIWNDPSPSVLAQKFRTSGVQYTYLELALLYVSEMQRTTAFMEQNFVTKNSANQYVEQFPLDPRKPGSGLRINYSSAQSASAVIVWDQQAMINNGFQRLVECYEIIRTYHIAMPSDPRNGPPVPNWKTLQMQYNTTVQAGYITLINNYDAYVNGSLRAFFDDAQLTALTNQNQSQPELATYLTWRIGTGGVLEDTSRGSFLMGGLFRAYFSGRYRDAVHKAIPSTENMQEISNGQVDIVVQSRPNKCIPTGQSVWDPDKDLSWSYYVDGTSPTDSGYGCSPRAASMLTLALRPDAFDRIAPHAVRGGDFYLYAHLLAVKNRIAW